MKTYIAKWPNGTISIVKVNSKKDLFWKLDLEGDPESAEVFLLPAEKDGSMHIALDLIKINKKYVIDFDFWTKTDAKKIKWP